MKCLTCQHFDKIGITGFGLCLLQSAGRLEVATRADQTCTFYESKECNSANTAKPTQEERLKDASAAN